MLWIWSETKNWARKGFYLGYDHIGTEGWSSAAYAMPDEKRIELVLEMIRSGFLKHIVLANDTNGWSVGLVHRETQKHAYAHLLRNFVPKLAQAGVTQDQIHTMLVETPAKLLPF
jgi:phosphotriesterase-related protein